MSTVPSEMPAGTLDFSSINVIGLAALQGVFNVKTYGAKGDGVTDDAAAIQNAINAVQNNHGGVLFFPAGTYAVSATLAVNAKNVKIIGSGAEWNHDTGSILPASSLKWIGAAGGTILSVSAISVAGGQDLSGCDVSGIAFLANGLAATGLAIRSASGGRFMDLYFDAFTAQAVYCGVVATLGEYQDTQHNVFQRIAVDSYNGDGNAFYLDGSGTANTSLNHFDCLALKVRNGNGIVCNNADNNVFTNVGISRANGGTGAGVVFNANGYSNVFFRLSAPACGVTANTGSQNNSIWAYDVGANGSPPPVLNGTATLFYNTDQQYFYFGAHVGIACGYDTNTTALAKSRKGANESLRIVNGANNHMKIDDGVTNTWSVALDVSGNLRLIQTAGSGALLDVSAPIKVDGSNAQIVGGNGAPSGNLAAGSIYLRTDGSTGSRFYVSAGAGVWNAVAGV